MKSKHKWMLIVIVLLLLSPVLLIVANLVHIKIRLYALGHADHSRILAACREAIARRGTYRNDNAQWGLLYKDRVVILPPLPDNLPLAIRELHPKDVIIDENSVLLNLSLPFSRISLIGYKSGARQAGTFRYIDGLWLWHGSKESEKSDTFRNEAVTPLATQPPSGGR
jgi:hypothetical protein